MDLWSTRRASLELLESELAEHKASIYEAFGLIDKAIDFFNEHAADVTCPQSLNHSLLSNVD